MTDEELLNEIKKRLSITGNFHDELLLSYANDTKDFLISSGLKTETINDRKCIGLISRGVADLWNFGSGDGKFSELFMQRLTQLVVEDNNKE